jgi:hypothetical protein
MKEQRLRIVAARAGESLEQLAARTRSSWKAQEIAVANALTPGVRLQAGQLVKVAIAEPYQTRSGQSPAARPGSNPAPSPAPRTAPTETEQLEPL